MWIFYFKYLFMPFTAEEFINVFRKYNQDIYPWQILFYFMAGLAIALSFKNSIRSSRWTALLLSLLWIWMGVVYHLIYFSVINNAAYLFGIAFILQGFILFYEGFINRQIKFQFIPDLYGVTGLVIILYSLILYPVLGYVAGHIYPSSPTFGLPCPTTIFTFGIMLWTQPQMPKATLIIPMLWAVVGLSAVLTFGMVEDTGLILSGLLATSLLLLRDRKKHSAPYPSTK
jgi:hypothetical protein